MTEPKSETKRVETSSDGNVIITVESRVTEKEIVQERDLIVLRLHAAYLTLTDEMSEFQREWDAGPTVAFLNSAREGWNAGSASWLSDQAEMFDTKLWMDLGSKIKAAAGASYDRIATYSFSQFESMKRELNKHVKDPSDTLYNWAWWQRTIETEADEFIQRKRAAVSDAIGSGISVGQSILASATIAKKIYYHREAILSLPELVALGDPVPIQAFVETVLMDIDPELAKEIRYHPNFPVVLEILADHESATAYLAYVSLILEAIPPNFYAYVAGRGSAYLMIEVVMLLVSALLSAGTAIGVRITMLTARFAAAGAKVITTNSKLKRARSAIQAFVRVLEDLSSAVDDLHNLGVKLVEARAVPLVVRGQTKSTLTARKAAIKRDKKCRRCGSTKHTTPRIRVGNVQYK